MKYIKKILKDNSISLESRVIIEDESDIFWLVYDLDAEQNTENILYSIQEYETEDGYTDYALYENYQGASIDYFSIKND